MPCRFIKVSASASVASGEMVIGFTTIPLSYRFTCRTCSACSSGVRLRWMTPSPPACAIAMAIRLSVTVSIAEARRGRLTLIERVTHERTSAWDGRISEWPGVSNTSSKVRASGKDEVS
jgi:hypothetical protein